MSNNVGGIKIESGEKREFNTGAKKQPASGKGTPVLFPPDAYLEISKHFEDGAVVYSPRNWEKGIPLSKLIDSLERHIAQEKMGLTDERHDRALAWNAVVYLATKLRIQAGILPAELADIPDMGYQQNIKDLKNPNEPYKGHGTKNNKYMRDDITIEYSTRNGYYIYDGTEYLWKDLKFHSMCCSDKPDYTEGYYQTKEEAEKYFQKYLKKGGD